MKSAILLLVFKKISYLHFYSDGTRVEPEPEKPGFMHENWNPGSENQNPGFSGFKVLLLLSRFHSLISFSVTFEMDLDMKIQLSSFLLS